MRTLERWRDNERPGNWTLLVALESGEETPSEGSLVTDLEDIGVVRVRGVRKVDSPEPGLRPGERVIALDVESIETTGDVPDIP